MSEGHTTVSTSWLISQLINFVNSRDELRACGSGRKSAIPFSSRIGPGRRDNADRWVPKHVCSKPAVSRLVLIDKTTVGAPYSPSSERKRSCPDIVCIMSKVDSFCIFRFRGAAIAGETSMVNWRFISSPGRRNPCKSHDLEDISASYPVLLPSWSRSSANEDLYSESDPFVLSQTSGPSCDVRIGELRSRGKKQNAAGT